jgi:hypothetical protein
MKPIKTAKQRTAEIARARGERVWVKDLQDQRSEPLLGRIFTDEHPCDTRNPFEGMRKRHSLGSYNLSLPTPQPCGPPTARTCADNQDLTRARAFFNFNQQLPT